MAGLLHVNRLRNGVPSNTPSWDCTCAVCECKPEVPELEESSSGWN